jgi:hypothetical protein
MLPLDLGPVPSQGGEDTGVNTQTLAFKGSISAELDEAGVALATASPVFGQERVSFEVLSAAGRAARPEGVLGR